MDLTKEIAVSSFEEDSFSTTIVADPIKLFFLRFPIFADKLGHFIFNELSLYVSKHSSLTTKNRKFLLCKEKKFNRIGYKCQFHQHFTKVFASIFFCQKITKPNCS
jgi:hypothetical protein